MVFMYLPAPVVPALMLALDSQARLLCRPVSALRIPPCLSAKTIAPSTAKMAAVIRLRIFAGVGFVDDAGRIVGSFSVALPIFGADRAHAPQQSPSDNHGLIV